MLAFVGGIAAGAALYHYCYTNKKESPLPSKSDQQLKSTDKVSSGTEVSVEPGMISYRLKRNTPSFKETSPAVSPASARPLSGTATPEKQRSPPQAPSAPNSTPSSRTSSLTKVTSASMVETALPYKGEVLATIN